MGSRPPASGPPAPCWAWLRPRCAAPPALTRGVPPPLRGTPRPFRSKGGGEVSPPPFRCAAPFPLPLREAGFAGHPALRQLALPANQGARQGPRADGLQPPQGGPPCFIQVAGDLEGFAPSGEVPPTAQGGRHPPEIPRTWRREYQTAGVGRHPPRKASHLAARIPNIPGGDGTPPEIHRSWPPEYQIPKSLRV